jgi:hypothetical protein
VSGTTTRQSGGHLSVIQNADVQDYPFSITDIKYSDDVTTQDIKKLQRRTFNDDEAQNSNSPFGCKSQYRTPIPGHIEDNFHQCYVYVSTLLTPQTFQSNMKPNMIKEYSQACFLYMMQWENERVG